MQARKIVLFLVMALGMAHQASATATNLGTIDNSSGTFGRLVGQGSFTDTLSFQLGQVSNLSGLIGELFVNPFNINLTGPSTNYSSTLSGLINVSTYSFSSLAPGSYTLTLSGIGATNLINGYAGTYKVAAAPAVPEADTWLMLIVGAGLVGFQLRRKQRALPVSGVSA
jgi:hypothetical protein